jgi:hypothetical protein
MNTTYRLPVSTMLVCLLSCVVAQAQVPLSPNGYSGLGIVPTARTLEGGKAFLSFDPTMPGAPHFHGYNTQVGLGLTDGLELVGRLATNDLKCNMFKSGACPVGTFRDFSSSMKWSLPIDWLKKNDAAFALGVTDFGGAATFFRSYYAVGTKNLGNFAISLGKAKGKADAAVLDGNFGALTWRASDYITLSAQRVGEHSTAHAMLSAPILSDGTSAWLTLNRRASDTPVMDKNWIGWGVSVPLDRVEKKEVAALINLGDASVHKANRIPIKPLKAIEPTELSQEFKLKGFFNPKIAKKLDGTLYVQVENTAYQHNILDASGVALGVIASAYTKINDQQNFELVVTTRGIKQILLKGEAKCVGMWLSGGQVCPSLSVSSMSQRAYGSGLFQESFFETLGALDSSFLGSSGSAWAFRPEIIISPTLVNAIGTEYGSFDIDLGANINTVIPLWSGATIESNRVKPLGVGTQNFEARMPFYGSRLKAVTNRSLIHQLVNVPSMNTQARLSWGKAYTDWEGRQIETSTQSDNGRHKLGFTQGAFENTSVPYNMEKHYKLTSYRYAHNDQQTSVTELTQGKFWGGDRGFSINQRFWHGDVNLNVYFRRTRMTELSPLVSFAGIQVSLPFTPRENKGGENLALRGVSQWVYSIETKVLEKDNRVTGGFGEVPKIGDSLVMTFNRDRNSTRYYEANLSRLQNAYTGIPPIQ